VCGETSEGFNTTQQPAAIAATRGAMQRLNGSDVRNIVKYTIPSPNNQNNAEGLVLNIA
jgi:hypothetical protein